MVEDYLSDREQEEALRAWWKDNWRWLLGGIALGVALLAGYYKWQDYREKTAESAAKEYEAVRVAAEGRNLEQTQNAFTKLTADHASTAYAQQARMLLAKLNADAGKYAESAALLREVVSGAKDEELADVARLRLARLLIQQGKYDDALAQLKVEDLGAFAAVAREIRGDAMVAKGDQSGARAEYAAALEGADAQINRPMIELKLQEVGGTAPASSPKVAP